MTPASIRDPRGYKVPWPIRAAVYLRKAVPYRHNYGAVVWVRLSASVARAVERQLPRGWLTRALKEEKA